MTTDLFQSLLSNIGSIALVVLFFGGSIFVHELGHFWAARRRGVRVERFSIGFGPKIFSWRGKDGVEYCLSWLPLGGYVALPQLADMRAIEGESDIDTESLPPISYTSKIIVFAAGATMNMVFAFVLACIVWIVGQPTSSSLSSTTVAEVLPQMENGEGKMVPSPASLAGLQAGDIILKVDGIPVQWFGEIVEQLSLGSGWNADGQRQTIFTIQRNGQTMDVTIRPILSGSEKLRKVGFATVAKLVVGKVTPASPAESMGLQINDQIIAVNQKSVLTISQLVESLQSRDTSHLVLTVLRGERRVNLTSDKSKSSKDSADIGIALKSGVIFTHPTPLKQISTALSKTADGLFALINPRSDLGLSHMTGPIGIIRSFFDLAQEGLPFALWFSVIINVNLAIFNLLPIPVLDGGHMLFATIARLRGRPLPLNWVMTAQSVFMVLLFSMILYVSFFDVRRIVRDVRADRAEATAPAK
ncbi:MAG: RIP metalloprotease RseP [Opitutae bacterium]|nr:RIP metalloprotease RseP [Opitutae bacterium]